MTGGINNLGRTSTIDISSISTCYEVNNRKPQTAVGHFKNKLQEEKG